MFLFVKLILLLPIVLKLTQCANILYVDQIPYPSHHIWNQAFALALAKSGHNVTILTHYEDASPPPNYHTILMEGISEDFDMDEVTDNTFIEAIKLLYDWSYKVCKFDFTTQGLKKLMTYPKNHFDLVVYDVTLTYCLYPLIDNFDKPPVVAVTSFLFDAVISNIFGNSLKTSYFPYFCAKFSDKMSFMERLYNSIYIFTEVFYRKYYGLPHEERLARTYFGDTFRSFEEIERSITLLLTNTDPVLSYPLDLPPNIIPVGGLHIAPAKRLPEDLQKLMDDAKDGVILFTLGSHFRSDQLILAKRTKLIKAFEKLPQLVLWKFESENITLPKNVVIRKWLPQRDILGHKNTKLFITHGGGMGTQEAMYYGVPIVAIPFFTDQTVNAVKFEARKMGKTLNYRELENQDVYGIISEVLNDPSYTNNIKLLSERHRDQPQTPLERAVFWIQYVIRHGGAEHLNIAARDMHFYQMYNFDIILFVLGLFFLLYYSLILLYNGLKCVVCKYFSSNVTDVSTSKKRK